MRLLLYTRVRMHGAGDAEEISSHKETARVTGKLDADVSDADDISSEASTALDDDELAALEDQQERERASPHLFLDLPRPPSGASKPADAPETPGAHPSGLAPLERWACFRVRRVRDGQADPRGGREGLSAETKSYCYAQGKFPA